MTSIVIARYLDKYDVEVIRKTAGGSYRVRALDSQPFGEGGFGWWAPTAYATVSRESLSDIRIEQVAAEDPAAEDAEAEYRQSAEYLDRREIDMTRYYGEA